MGGHCEQMHPAVEQLHDEQDVEAAQRDGLNGEEIGGQPPRGLNTAVKCVIQCLFGVVLARGRRGPVGFQKSVTYGEQWLHAARSYSLIKPYRIGRRLSVRG
jgi:hypothetical protein